MGKLKIAVIFGGCSPEHAVSLESAYSVISHMNREAYEPIPIGISPRGEWFRFYGGAGKIKDGAWNNPADCVRAVISPSRAVHGILEMSGDRLRQVRLDAALPVLHGKNGEDGTVQGLLELAGIPVAGCKTLCSALCMDKDRAHKLVSQAGVRVPHSFIIEGETDIGQAAARAKTLGYPLFVKPVKAGSSLGVTKAAGDDELAEAVRLAFEYDSSVIVEECIPGFEVGCAVLGTERLITGELDEIELAAGFFDYHEKYTLETSAIHVPARIAAGKAAEIKETAKEIYRALDCSGFARVDMFLTPSGEIVFNEVNTIPGFTAHSRFPNMLKAAGMPFEEIIDRIIRQAVKE
jgi:D-alanine---D-serine ligase